MRSKRERGPGLLKGLTLLMFVITICIIGYGRKSFSERTEVHKQSAILENKIIVEEEAIEEMPVLEMEEAPKKISEENLGDRDILEPENGQVEEVVQSSKKAPLEPAPVQKPVEVPAPPKPAAQPALEKQAPIEEKVVPLEVLEEPKAPNIENQEIEAEKNIEEDHLQGEPEASEPMPTVPLENKEEESDVQDTDMPNVE
ncbi:MAG: hypothetical protein AB2421_14260 [Thermotaleaceae bacterium]